jgi:hypothetical protein
MIVPNAISFIFVAQLLAALFFFPAAGFRQRRHVEVPRVFY